MVTSDIFVNTSITAFYTVKILPKETENIVAIIFIFCCQYSVVNLTQARIKTIEILIFDIFLLEQKLVTGTHQSFIHFFCLHKKLIKNIFILKITNF